MGVRPGQKPSNRFPARPVVIAGIAATVAAAWLCARPPAVLQPLSSAALDGMMRLNQTQPRSGAIVLVEIDEASLALEGGWPWPRHRIASLTRALLDGGASVVAFDILFADHDRLSPASVHRDIAHRFGADWPLSDLPPRIRDFDALLADELSRGRTLLACYAAKPKRTPVQGAIAGPHRGFVSARGSGHINDLLPLSDGPVFSIPELTDAAANSAVFSVVADADGVVRSLPLVWRSEDGRLHASAAMEAARMHTGADEVVVEHSKTGIRGVRMGRKWIPTDAQGRLIVNYRAGGGFDRHSAASVLAGQTGAGAFKDKIAYVGMAAGSRSATEIHATVTDNILAGNSLHQPAWSRVFDVVSVVISGALLLWCVLRRHAAVPFGAFVTLSLLIAGVATLLWRVGNVAVVPSNALLAVAAAYAAPALARFAGRAAARERIRGRFGAHVSPDTLGYLDEHPEHARMHGRRTEATVLFAGVTDFSRMAEGLPPEKLAELMNIYLTRMARLVMGRKGCVDKFIGDTVVAAWGVPCPMPDHALQACLAALEQKRMIESMQDEYRALFGQTFHVRFGINTGFVTAGDMGSTDRPQFTVMGSSVNAAAALEKLNVEYGTSMLIGEETRRGAGGAVVARQLDRVKLPGREEPAAIYELMGEAADASPARFRFIEAYERALDLHARGEFAPALEAVELALSIEPDDTPSRRLRRIIRDAMGSNGEKRNPGLVGPGVSFDG